jgi:hypothetical protein
VTDAGSLEQVYSVCPSVADAGSVYALDGGAWVLPYPHGPRLACMLEGCQEYVRRSESKVPAFSSEAVTLMVVLSLLGALAGLASGWAIERWLR